MPCWMDVQSVAMILWSFATLRHEHDELFEALARRGLELIPVWSKEEAFSSRTMFTCVWVSPTLAAALVTARITAVHP